MRFNNESSLFALERDNNFKSIIMDIYQSFDRIDAYPTIQEKCANLIYFLNSYNILFKDNKQIIDNNTLAALTLLIAESNPKEKEILIDLILNFLN